MTGNTYGVDGAPGVPREEGESLAEAAHRLRATCTVEQRRSITDAADTLRSHPKVAGADVLTPREGPRDAWTCEITCTTDTCPPGVLHPLASARLHIVEARPRGTGFWIVETA